MTVFIEIVCSGQIVKSKGSEKGNLVDITYL